MERRARGLRRRHHLHGAKRAVRMPERRNGAFRSRVEEGVRRRSASTGRRRPKLEVSGKGRGLPSERSATKRVDGLPRRWQMPLLDIVGGNWGGAEGKSPSRPPGEQGRGDAGRHLPPKRIREGSFPPKEIGRVLSGGEEGGSSKLGEGDADGRRKDAANFSATAPEEP